MSYHIYTTTGIVLAERPAREADRVYTIFTRDLGLVHASAIGARKDLSKLRGHIEPFSLSSVSLVRGREYWRLTSAELIDNLKTKFAGNASLFLALVKNLSLLEKLVAGEEKHIKLFDDIAGIIDFAGRENLTDTDSESVEILMAAKILFNLGYLSADNLQMEIFGDKLTKEILDLVSHDKKSLIKAINHGIQSSQLA